MHAIRKRRIARLTLLTGTVLALAAQGATPARAATALARDGKTTTPIKHVLVIIGENRSFDHVFATFTAPSGEPVGNLLSKGIINKDGTPGPNFSLAKQRIGSVPTTYSISPQITGDYATLPPENTGGTPSLASDKSGPPFATFARAQSVDYGLLREDIPLLLTGATGLRKDAIDRRIANYDKLPNGPFQLTNGMSYDSYTVYPTHRFFQMWQQVDCAVARATTANPSGCSLDLFPWVETSIGNGSVDANPPVNRESTHEGAAAMSFFNMARGDAPYLRALAAKYTISDNYHQPIMGGTGVNSLVLGTGDMLFYSDSKGPAVPKYTSQIEDPNPRPGTNNFYIRDGDPVVYTHCADTTKPEVAAITNYLAALPYHPDPKCAPGTYYMVNNAHPGFYGNGSRYDDKKDAPGIPPSSTPTIADVLLDAGISWRFYMEGWNLEAQVISGPFYPFDNPFLYETRVMADKAVRTTHLKDTTDFYNDLTDEALPAVAFVKPGAYNDGHPQSSKLNLFEAFLKKILTQLQANPALARSTAVFVTFDESGGYYDSGYIQPLDFFGDGPRIPLIAISPYTRGGHVSHIYTDHVSILKFIEKNWGLRTISTRSRDNLPNPSAAPSNPYVPTNSPAIGDLMDMFRF